MNTIDNPYMPSPFISSGLSTIYFFGYGSYRSKERVAEILGHVPFGGYGGIIDGYVLTFQTLDQLPAEPKEILEKIWGDSFRAYTIRPGKGLIAGVVWELTKADTKKIRVWEFDGVWREFPDVVVKTSDGRTIHALTDVALPNQQVKHVVDGLYYQNNMNAQGKKSKKDEYRIHDTKRARKMLQDIATKIKEEN